MNNISLKTLHDTRDILSHAIQCGTKQIITLNDFHKKTKIVLDALSTPQEPTEHAQEVLAELETASSSLDWSEALEAAMAAYDLIGMSINDREQDTSNTPNNPHLKVTHSDKLVTAIRKLPIDSFKTPTESVSPRTVQAVALYIADRYNVKQAVSWHSVDAGSIGEAVGTSIRTVRRAISVLKTVGVFEVVNTLKGNIYKLGQKVIGLFAPVEPQESVKTQSDDVTGFKLSKTPEAILEAPHASLPTYPTTQQSKRPLKRSAIDILKETVASFSSLKDAQEV